MKKYLFYIFTFLACFVLFDVGNVSAKSEVINNIEVSFGDENILNLGYSEISEFKIRDDMSFYFNGVKHQFDDDYTMLDSTLIEGNTIIIEGETLTIDKESKLVKSSKVFQTYTFFVGVEFLETNTSVYRFKQQLCYTMNNIEHCNEDVDDVYEISASRNFAFYYDFVPFYDESIIFESISYKFTLTNDQNNINFPEITFNANEINYKDYFVTAGYRNVIVNGDNYFMVPYIYDPETPNVLYLNAQFVHGYSSPVLRNYRLNLMVCIGENYSNCLEGETFTKNNVDNSAKYYRIPLTNMYYDSQSGKVYTDDTKSKEIRKFLLKGKYVCVNGDNSDCSDPRAVNTISYTNEQIYEFDLMDPKNESELNGINYDCYQGNRKYTCYGVKDVVTNKVLIRDDNEIESIYYYLGKTMVNYLDEINTPINNGDDLTLGEGLYGYYYLYYKVKDATGAVNYFGPYRYLFDGVGPTLSEDNENFEEYSSNDSYNEIILTVKYVDTYFKESEDVYFKVISEAEYNEFTSDMIVESYENGVRINNYVTSDGTYRVCFRAKDYLDNYSEVTCAGPYYLDTTPLDKNEVSVTSTSNDNFQKTLEVNIDISGVNEGVVFKCDLISIDLVDVTSNMLSNDCYNKENNAFIINKEGRFNLWIYASDYAKNYSLIKFDDIYLIDNLAPRISYLIDGNNTVYSNNVLVDVNGEDLNQIISSSYMFYFKTYNESDFMPFDIDDGITYPFDYYGDYKLAIKVCDVIGNCSISTSDTIFKIDTSKIKLDLLGEEEIVVLRWGKYKELGVVASKGNGGKYPVKVDYEISSNVDMNNVGEYYVTYTSGTGINQTSITRKVIVKDSVPYLISLISLIALGEAIILLRLFIKKRKNDSI